MELIRPALPYVSNYADALQRGWTPDNMRGRAAAEEELQRIASGPLEFVESLTDPEGKGPPITHSDGSRFPRLPGVSFWMWDGEFCGSIGLRWAPGTNELPPYCLGHVGYAVVPWKTNRGYATRALGLLLPVAREHGLEYVDLTTDPDNVASQRVILANSGILQREFRTVVTFGGKMKLLYRIQL